MKLVVGLGNPGEKYRGTRHNVGFEILGALAQRWQAERPKMRFSGECSEAFVGGQKLLLLAPLTYMNRSGECVQQVVRFYQLPPEDMVVICDDMNLPTGRIRWKAAGSAGGQNGLDDILNRLGTRQVPRLRVGIGRPAGQRDATSWVLGRYSPAEREEMDVAVQEAADSVECWIRNGIDAAMNQYNATGKPDQS
jgi:PTH1 family peptidyl-tRNA hydrolase